jgi:hypothetical protein
MRTKPHGAQGFLLLSTVFLLAISGCSGSPTPVSTIPSLVEPAEWPTGVRALVVRTAHAFQVLGRGEVLLSDQLVDVPADKSAETSAISITFSISANHEYLAYRLGNEDLTVWRIGRGQEARHFAVGEGDVEGISDDGRYVSLVQGRISALKGPPVPPILHLKIVDTASGREVQPSAFIEYLRAPSPCALVSSAWLSDDTYLVSLSSGGNTELCLQPKQRRDLQLSVCG